MAIVDTAALIVRGPSLHGRSHNLVWKPREREATLVNSMTLPNCSDQ